MTLTCYNSKGENKPIKEKIMTPQQKTENWEKEEWNGWKIVSDMLDHPDKDGIYPTGKCYRKLYEFVIAQKTKAIQSRDSYWLKKIEEIEKGIDKLERVTHPQITDHEFIDTCKIYLMLQKLKKDH